MEDTLWVNGESGRNSSRLNVQPLENINVKELNPLHNEIISKQATINIGTIGHVAHGKSTVVKAISGVQTVRFKNELERNITIKLGYANAKIYKCDSKECEAPGSYCARGSNHPDVFQCTRPGCTGNFCIVRHVSFVDCPGHDILMATMLNGAAVMDAALLLIAGNEPCPQPQTAEHLAAIEVMKLKRLMILQNKIDLIKQKQAEENYHQITKFIKGTVAENSPVIPISAQFKYNIDAVCEYIVNCVPVPVRNYEAPARLIIVRSFDVNKPGCEVEDLKGGIAGGSITQGILHVGQVIEIRPGVISKDDKGNLRCKPIRSKIISLCAEKTELSYATPGGLIGVGTTVDPALCRADRMVGQLLGSIDGLPQVYSYVEINFVLLRRYLGVRTEGDQKAAKISSLKKGDCLLVNIGSLSTGCKVMYSKGDLAKLTLTQPVCAELHERIALSRKLDDHWRLIGWGTIIAGAKIELLPPS